VSGKIVPCTHPLRCTCRISGVPSAGVNPATSTMSFNWYRHNPSLLVTIISYFLPTSTSHFQKSLGQKATGQNMKQITNRLNDIRRNILFLDIQKLNISLGCNSIQIGIVAAIGEANPTFRRRVPDALQNHSRSKVVLKLGTRSSVNFGMKTDHIGRTLGKNVLDQPVLNAALTTVKEGQTLLSQPSCPFSIFRSS
jgi:hypothetical protein